MILIEPRKRLRPTGSPVGRIAFPERESSSCRRQCTCRCPTRLDSDSRSSPVRTDQDPRGCIARPHTPNTSVRTCPCPGSNPHSRQHNRYPMRSPKDTGSPSDGIARRSRRSSDRHSRRSATSPAADSRSIRSCRPSHQSTVPRAPCRSSLRPASSSRGCQPRQAPPRSHPCRMLVGSCSSRVPWSNDQTRSRPSPSPFTMPTGPPSRSGGHG